MSNKKKQKKIKLKGSSFWYKNKPLNAKPKSNFFSIKIDTFYYSVDFDKEILTLSP